MGAYFSLIAYKNEEINKTLFLSPVINMEYLIENMMKSSNVTPSDLELKQEIKTDFGVILYWDYYKYVKDNPVEDWKSDTYILYGSNDNMQSKVIIDDFCRKFNCKLQVLNNGEHYFHTEDDLKFYKEWLDIII